MHDDRTMQCCTAVYAETRHDICVHAFTARILLLSAAKPPARVKLQDYTARISKVVAGQSALPPPPYLSQHSAKTHTFQDPTGSSLPNRVCQAPAAHLTLRLTDFFQDTTSFS